MAKIVEVLWTALVYELVDCEVLTSHSVEVILENVQVGAELMCEREAERDDGRRLLAMLPGIRSQLLPL